jgi:thiamine biosynthesis lipoprotein
MPACFRRARPCLGTIVEIRVEGLRESDAQAALDAAFAEVACVHRCMSFHGADSDLSRIHRATVGSIVALDPRTWEVLHIAQNVELLSRGIFNIAIASRLVARDCLPRPASPFVPDPAACWRDVELLPDHSVRLRKPLWIDLGGIAKGYAVDRAIDVLRARGATQACVNAGGDLRVFGARAELVWLRTHQDSATFFAAVELVDAAVATSSAFDAGGAAGAHVHGVTLEPVRNAATASVVAERCVIADALTKVVLAGDAAAAAAALAAFGAEASVHDPVFGWTRLEQAA